MLSFLISSAKLLTTATTIDGGSTTGLQTPTYAPSTSWGNCLVNGTVATLSCIPTIVSFVINWIFGFAAITALFFVLFSGIKFLTSGGDPKQVEGARKTLTFAIIGLIVILLSFAIIDIISKITGASCIVTFGFLQC